MNIIDAILQLKPNARLDVDMLVEDDGSGPKITHWDTGRLGPKPTQAQLDAQAIPVAKKYKRDELLAGFRVDWIALFSVDGDYFPEWPSVIALTAANQRSATETQKVTSARALKDKLDTKLASNRAATTEADVNAITWA